MAITPKVANKTAPAAPVVSDKEKANRLTLIVSLVPKLSGFVTKMRNAEKAARSAMFDIVTYAQKIIAEKSLSGEEGTQLLRLAIAESWGIPVEELSGKDAMKNHPNAYSVLSRVKSMAFPVDATQAKRLAKAMADGETAQTCLTIARKAGMTIEEARTAGKTPSQKRAAGSAGGQGSADGAGSKKSPDTIEDEETAKTYFAVGIARCKKGGMDLETIGEYFADQLAEFEAEAAGN